MSARIGVPVMMVGTAFGTALVVRGLLAASSRHRLMSGAGGFSISAAPHSFEPSAPQHEDHLRARVIPNSPTTRTHA
ncbi:uncharacterized protein AMSG_01204 [Thecamonas trahens ATCC 50062]|uniref:Uncharacterized protein n=1 Tax=Thecamonas trahens ATCC 50062 TaxID=461836 RepID=A0A0L0DMJ2_THETB|nr:hypothetical protein AMSG_01204 [Thecamonas trahens ATCC 50062]KNC53490.1 hypothetical protein AMSG_01204 [Thecamonas trahens ATCC 50062]|eukprot:XP_013761812.1 hypothetical protein AMSG_01204 [Thecamonas trahens ATCC 50062]